MESITGQKPKYQIITDDILMKIRNNDFSYNTVLCTEMQLVEEYGVSRITAKRALTDLEQRGILYRKRGVGSFVARNALNNLGKQATASTVSKIVAFLLPFDIASGNMFETVKAVNDILNDNDFLLSIYIAGTSAKEKTNIRMLSSQNISGLIYYPLHDNFNLNMINKFVFAKTPVIIMDKHIDCPYLGNVTSDDFTGGKLLVHHLAELGHKNIGFLTTAPIDETSTVRNRFGGYLQQMLEEGLDPDPSNVICTPYEVTEEDICSGQSAFCNAIQQMYINGVTALLTENDRVAQLAVYACSILNIRVPEDLSICGFDDQTIAKEYDITTVHQDFAAIGSKIGELMLDAIHNNTHPAKRITIPVELVVRGSTSIPKVSLLQPSRP